MRLQHLSVKQFQCIESAEVEFGPGLNVLFGPNDLGKSSLAWAIRAVLLLQHNSSVHERFVSWYGDGEPRVALTFCDDNDRVWRVTKTFSSGTAGHSKLDASRDGRTFTPDCNGRQVDDKLRTMFGWGIQRPGGTRASHGLPQSFLTQVLLAEQDSVRKVLFETTLAKDHDESGRLRLIEALGALAQDPLFKQVLGETQENVGRAFTATGRKTTKAGSPFIEIAAQLKAMQQEHAELTEKVRETELAEVKIRELTAERDELHRNLEEATETLATTRRHFEARQRRDGIQAQLTTHLATVRSVEELQRTLDRSEGEIAQRKAAVDAAASLVVEAKAAAQRNEAARDEARRLLDAMTHDDVGHERQVRELEERKKSALERFDDADRAVERSTLALRQARGAASEISTAAATALDHARLAEASEAASVAASAELELAQQAHAEATQLLRDVASDRGRARELEQKDIDNQRLQRNAQRVAIERHSQVAEEVGAATRDADMARSAQIDLAANVADAQESLAGEQAKLATVDAAGAVLHKVEVYGELRQVQGMVEAAAQAQADARRAREAAAALRLEEAELRARIPQRLPIAETIAGLRDLQEQLQTADAELERCELELAPLKAAVEVGAAKIREALAEVERDEAVRDEARQQLDALTHDVEHDRRMRALEAGTKIAQAGCDEADRAAERAREALRQASGVASEVSSTAVVAIENARLARTAEDAALAALADVERCRQAHAGATQRVRDASSDDSARLRELQQKDVETQRLKRSAQRSTSERDLAVASQVGVRAGEAASARGAQLALSATVTSARESLASEEAKLVEVEAAGELLCQVEVFGELRQVQGAAEVAAQAQQSASLAREAAAALRQEEEALRARIPPRLPTAEAIAALRDLREQRRTADARLGGGVSVIVRPKQPIALTATADGVVVPVTNTDAAVPLAANQVLLLGIGDLVELEITAGEEGARNAAASVRERWNREGARLLAEYEVDTIEQLEELRRDADALLRAADDRRRDAAFHEERAALGPMIGDTTRLAARVAELEAELGDANRADLATTLAQLGERWQAAVKRQIDENTATQRTHAAELNRLRGELTRLETQLDVQTAEADGIEQDVRRRQEELGEDWSIVVARCQREIVEADRDLELLGHQVGQLAGGASNDLRAAEQQLESAAAALELATRRYKDLQGEGQRSRDAAVQATTTLDGARSRARELDVNSVWASDLSLHAPVLSLTSWQEAVAVSDALREQRKVVRDAADERFVQQGAARASAILNARATCAAAETVVLACRGRLAALQADQEELVARQVSTGEDEARQKAAALSERWNREGQRALAEQGVDTIEQLEALRREADATLGAADRCQRDALLQEARGAQATDASESPEWTARLAELEAELGDANRAELATRFAGLGDRWQVALKRQVEDNAAMRNAQVAKIDHLRGDLTRLQTQLDARSAEAVSLERESARRQADLPDHWRVLVTRYQHELGEIDRELEALERRAALLSGSSDDEQSAESQVVEASRLLALAAKRHKEAQVEAQRARDASIQAATKLEGLRTRARELDVNAVWASELGFPSPALSLATWQDDVTAAEELRDQRKVARDAAEERFVLLGLERSAAVQAARAAFAEAEKLAVSARTRLSSLQSDQENAASAHSQAQVAMAETKVQLARTNVDDARRAIAGLHEQLASLEDEVGPGSIDAEDVAYHESTVDRLTAHLRDAHEDLARARGGLEQVGGAIVRERLRELDQAIRDARERERQIWVEYDAWKLLLETLRASESSEGAHLGRALAGPVSARFRQLTGGRYGSLELGAHLEATGLQAAGDSRPIDALSAGTQDQLATLLRLCIAEQLRSAIVLDDHLSQSDPSRVAWFNTVLRSAAQQVQIVLITCRPAESLGADEFPRSGDASATAAAGLVRAVDLSSLIRRFAPTPNERQRSGA